MKLFRTAAILFVLASLFAPRSADAAASGNTFSTNVLSSVSGSFGGTLEFVTDGTFVFTPDTGKTGTGSYSETVDATTGNSTLTAYGNDGDDYTGLFYAQTMNATIGTTPYLLIGGIGLGNAGDLFVFLGYVTDPAISEGAAARGTPRHRGRRE